MVYIDKVHMVADTLEELHNFAIKIGLKRHYFEGVRKGHPHYDLTNKSIREKAIENGAVVVSSKKIVELSHKLVSPKKER